jgi:hypothetical protein
MDSMKRACKFITYKVMAMLACEFHTTIKKAIITV